jgi:catechol 2,3-dioxygenase-like lactoylglutathione lyase family enzyme
VVRLAQTYLMVTDVAESVDFYETVFGLSVAERSADRAAFRTGECELVLQEDFAEETFAEFGLRPPESDRGEGVFVVLTVADVGAVAERAREWGAPVPAEPRTVDWGRTLCLVRDPDGYVIEAGQPD